MCGRFTQFYTWAEVHAFLGVLGDAALRNLQPRYNIAPTDTIDVAAIGKEGACKLVPMRWGLVPAWWRKDPKTVGATFNARREGLATKPMFRSALNEGRRCVIPISGFYEWTTMPGGKQPFFISGREQPVLGVAGLWDRWRDPAGDWLISATMIVQPANDFMGAIHTRMPVFVDLEDIGGWLVLLISIALPATSLAAWPSWQTQAFNLVWISMTFVYLATSKRVTTTFDYKPNLLRA